MMNVNLNALLVGVGFLLGGLFWNWFFEKRIQPWLQSLVSKNIGVTIFFNWHRFGFSWELNRQVRGKAKLKLFFLWLISSLSFLIGMMFFVVGSVFVILTVLMPAGQT